MDESLIIESHFPIPHPPPPFSINYQAEIIKFIAEYCDCFSPVTIINWSTWRNSCNVWKGVCKMWESFQDPQVGGLVLPLACFWKDDWILLKAPLSVQSYKISPIRQWWVNFSGKCDLVTRSGFVFFIHRNLRQNYD